MAVAVQELRQSYHPPVASEKTDTSTFDNGRLSKIIGIINQEDVIEAMRSAGAANAKGVAEMEGRRLGMLGDPFHEHLIRRPIRLGIASGVIQEGYTAIELGTSVFGQYAQMEEHLQPGAVLGFDSKEYIVAGARQAIKGYGDANLLHPERYAVLTGDHNYLRGIRGDVAILSLTSQYDSGVRGTVDWLMSHFMVAGINGDVIHSPMEISEEELGSGILPMRSKRLPYFGGYTGVNWKLAGKPEDNPFGQVYKATLLLDDAIYSEDSGIVQIPQVGAELAGEVTVFRVGERVFFEPWTWRLTNQATDEDVKNLRGIRNIFHEQYSLLEEVMKGGRVWESIAGLGVPIYAAEKYGASSVVMFDTATKKAKNSGMLPMAMLVRNGDEVEQIDNAGLFSEIGTGKTFPSRGSLYQAIGEYMANRGARFSAIVREYINPLLATSMTSKEKSVHDRLKTTAHLQAAA